MNEEIRGGNVSQNGALAGLRVIEVGVEWHDSPVSRVRPWQDAPQMLRDVLRVRFRRRRA